MAKALGARIFGGHGALETQAPAPIRKDRRRQNLPDRKGEGRHKQEGVRGAENLI